MKGKNYANRKPENERPMNDFYPTPSCMVRALLENDFFEENGRFGRYEVNGLGDMKNYLRAK